MKQLLVLSAKPTSSIDCNVERMMAFLGSEVVVVDRSHARAHLSEPGKEQLGFAGLALHANTLCFLLRGQDSLHIKLREMLSAGLNIFVYGFSEEIPREIKEFLNGPVLGLEAVSSIEFAQLPVAGKAFSRHLAGADYRRADAKQKTSVFLLAEKPNPAIPLITLSDKPAYLCIPYGAGHLFLSSARNFPNPEEYVGEEQTIEPFYDSLLPLLIFVRSTCGEFCWHGGYHGARLIIDDPVLRRTYGCLDFNKLFESLKQHKYAATVAYIPWNYSRTNPRHASWFCAAGEQFSLCVHGCDHMNNEYGITNAQMLRYKSQLAMERMLRHEKRTGLGFEPVMVFPQGRFSACSLRELRSTNFLAAINTTRFPVDDEKRSISFGTLLLPAVDIHYGFPVFGRHYPRSLFPFLFDLFLGRPSFIVEHHEFFRSGFPKIESLASYLNACEPRLAWGPLCETLERTCWKRATSSKLWEVRFFTDRFKVTNTTHERLSYRLWKQEPLRGTSGVVFFDGKSQPMEPFGDVLQADCALDPGQTAQVVVQAVDSPSQLVSNQGRLYASKVLLRRALSELRDEILVKHQRSLTVAKAVVKVLKMSSESNPQRGRQILSKR